MPFGHTPECVQCHITEANIWRTNENNETICNDCHLGIKRDEDGKADDNRSENGSTHVKKGGNSHSGPVRKSARLKPSKYRYQGSYSQKPLATKGKSRRVAFKKNVSGIQKYTNLCSDITNDQLGISGETDVVARISMFIVCTVLPLVKQWFKFTAGVSHHTPPPPGGGWPQPINYILNIFIINYYIHYTGNRCLISVFCYFAGNYPAFPPPRG